MSRSPTPWLLGDTSHDRTAAPAIGNPNLRLNQLQPGGCTQLHHLNEDVPLRAAVRASPSWWHRRTPTYLRPSAMSSNDPYKHQNSGVSGLLESGRAQMKDGIRRHKTAGFGIAANRRGGTFDDEFCTGALSTYHGDYTSLASSTDDAFLEPRTITEPLFVLHYAAF